MRPDMAKVIVERPRYGSRDPSKKKGYAKYLQKTPVDELPKNESMMGRWHGMGKCLNEHLGPMRRFLRSNIGRPWNKIHQELCEHISFDNAVQGHVLTHIDQYVHQRVEVTDSSTVFGHLELRRKRKLEAGEMYVCPNTDILKEVRQNRRHRIASRVSVDDRTLYLRRDDIWWEVRLRDRPRHSSNLWDVWLEKDVDQLTEQECNKSYGGRLFAYSKRALTREEISQLYRNRRQEKRSQGRTKRGF